MIALLIIGRPGSGKTHLAHKLLSGPRQKFILVDDPKDLKTLDCLTNEGLDVIICDPHLCRQDARDGCYRYLESKGYTVFSLFFENEPLKCEKNVAYRADGRLVSVKGITYDVPSGVKLLPIWQPNPNDGSETA
jgi:hypothetical protein